MLHTGINENSLVPDIPDPPRFPVVENILSEAVVLSWKPPLFDGGSYITGYLVEKRELPSGDWVPCTKTRFAYLTIENLKSQQTYEFRISAENKHGMSKPCEPTAPVAIKGAQRKRRGYDGKYRRTVCGLQKYFL